jgi:hypothetical protein
LVSNTIWTKHVGLDGNNAVYDSNNKNILISNASIVAFNFSNYSYVDFSGEWSCVFKLSPVATTYTSQTIHLTVNNYDATFADTSTTLPFSCEFMFEYDRLNGKYKFHRNNQGVQQEENVATAIQDTFYGNDIFFRASRSAIGTITTEIFDASYNPLCSNTTVANI